MKKCPGCQEVKSLDAFAWANKAKGKRQSKCKDCNRTYYQELYRNDPERRVKIAAANKTWRGTVKEYVRSQLSTGCVDCGNRDIRVLEFDHVRGDKVDGVAAMANGRASLARVKAEIEKCEVRCRNCHAIKTHEERGLIW